MKYEDHEKEYIAEAKRAFSIFTLFVAFMFLLILISPVLLLWVNFLIFLKTIFSLIFVTVIMCMVHKHIMKIATKTAKEEAKKDWEKTGGITNPTFRERLEKMMKDAQQEQASRK